MVATYRADELHRRHPLRPCSPSSSARPCRGGSSCSASTATSSPTSSPTSSARPRPPRWSSASTGAATATRCSPRSCSPPGSTAAAPLPPSLREALLLRAERLPARDPAPAAPARGRRPRRRRAARGGGRGRARSSSRRRSARRSTAQIVVVDEAERFGFRHALLREVLYDDLLPGERAELHLRSRTRSSGWPPRATRAWTRDRDRPPLLRGGRPAAGAGGGARRGPRRAAPARLRRGGGAARPGARALEPGADPEERQRAPTRPSCYPSRAAHYLAGDEDDAARRSTSARSRRSTRRPTPSGAARC